MFQRTLCGFPTFWREVARSADKGVSTGADFDLLRQAEVEELHAIIRTLRHHLDVSGVSRHISNLVRSIIGHLLRFKVPVDDLL